MGPVLLPLIAFVAGTVSITSPCCLPLLPGYLSNISSLGQHGWWSPPSWRFRFGLTVRWRERPRN
jgi:cytochrome c biogenesis protein CcdA